METNIILKPYQFSAFAFMITLTEEYYRKLVYDQYQNGGKLYDYQQDITHCEAARSLQSKCVKIFEKYKNKLFSQASIKLNYSEIGLITSGIIPADNNEYNVGVRQYVFEQCHLAVIKHMLSYQPKSDPNTKLLNQ